LSSKGPFLKRYYLNTMLHDIKFCILLTV
jgi:hypothetical protein